MTAEACPIGLIVGPFGTWAMLALAVGCFYAILINCALLVAKRRRWVR